MSLVAGVQGRSLVCRQRRQRMQDAALAERGDLIGGQAGRGIHRAGPEAGPSFIDESQFRM
jgi:hypothetical protein